MGCKKIYYCDKCKKTVNIQGKLSPLRFSLRVDGVVDDISYEAELCGNCVNEYKVISEITYRILDALGLNNP